MIDRKPKETDIETQKAIEDFLAKGGKIQYFEAGARTEDIEYKGGFYGRKKNPIKEKK